MTSRPLLRLRAECALLKKRRSKQEAGALEEEVKQRRAALEAEFVTKAAGLQAEFAGKEASLTDKAAQKQFQLKEQQQYLVCPSLVILH